jgi:hypothetical protein
LGTCGGKALTGVDTDAAATEAASLMSPLDFSDLKAMAYPTVPTSSSASAPVT